MSDTYNTAYTETCFWNNRTSVWQCVISDVSLHTSKQKKT